MQHESDISRKPVAMYATIPSLTAFAAILIATSISSCSAFYATKHSSIVSWRPSSISTISDSRYNVISTKLDAFRNLQTFFLSDSGLDAETLESLGDLRELNEALDGAIDAANPAVGILSKLVASPAFLAVPIGAGIAVSFIIGYFIFSYGQGKDD